jgi:hypothetical protein
LAVVDHRHVAGPYVGDEVAVAHVHVPPKTEAPIGAGIQNLLDLTGIQQDLLDPILGLVGSLGGMFTS